MAHIELTDNEEREVLRLHNHYSCMRNYYIETKYDYQKALEMEEKRDELERKYPKIFEPLPF